MVAKDLGNGPLPWIPTGTHLAASSHHMTFAEKVLSTCEVLSSLAMMVHLKKWVQKETGVNIG